MTLDSELIVPGEIHSNYDEDTDIEQQLTEIEEEEEEEPLKPNDNDDEEKNTNFLKKFPCPYEGCLAGFGKNNRLKAHIRVKHTLYFPYKCTYDNCESSFACQTYLNKHLLRHDGNLNSEKKKMKNADEKTKPTLSCDCCSEQFRTKSQLRNHQFKFHKSKIDDTTETVSTFNCDHCEAKFLLKSRLNSHKRRHRGYSCSYPDCDFRTDKWSELRKHLSTEHRKLECSVCRKQYSSAYNLRIHEQSIHNEHNDNNNDIPKSKNSKFECPDCSKSYQRESSLKIHIKTFHSEEPRYCCPFEEVCQRKFRHKKSLDYHLKSVDHRQQQLSTPSGKKKGKQQRKSKSQTILNQIQKKSRIKPLIDDDEFDEEDRVILDRCNQNDEISNEGNQVDEIIENEPKFSVEDFVESNLFQSTNC